ncbi:Mov34/MPN/PAD-1 family protein [Nostocaceae cyanobacterium CENA357]|uniref:Mov34/MPN/PAD-1 family protein n=1 Tax=Atlanticothrix silvestris CENA357 TaxID=1725252 RepID=A0A8J7L5R9_9CYAN|nr:Mov34/MPN/PAD-1 family protein [Atlanticothrix silvestris]MBH8554957.1 Mov34/MPN/PAD-1 family protein [Atlanticothrix silvestris CENA357]
MLIILDEFALNMNFTNENILSDSALERVYLHSRHSYPEECCGFILNDGVKECENVQNKLHKLDPFKYPRTARTAFTFSFEDLLFLDRSFNSNNPVRIIYHSHPDLGAYFSDEDRNHAIIDGEPIYPVKHLVIDVQSTRIGCAKLFKFVNGDYQLVKLFDGKEI